MAKALFSQPRFTNDDAARKHLESVRWPNGPICPHCGGTERNSRLNGESHRPGLIFCGDCRTQFTVTVGTVFERSKVPLHKWLLANHLLCSSKKGISTNQLHRTLGVTLKTAWFMAHRIREGMKPAAVVMEIIPGDTDETAGFFLVPPRYHSRKTAPFMDGNATKAFEFLGFAYWYTAEDIRHFSVRFRNLQQAVMRLHLKLAQEHPRLPAAPYGEID